MSPGRRPRRHRHGAGRADNFSARYDLDRIKGTFSRPAHKLYGQSYVDKILVLVTAKGGVASAWMLREMAARRMAPKAIIFDRANTILAQGAAFAEMTLVDRFEAGDPTRLIENGDMLTIDPEAGPGHDPEPGLIAWRKCRTQQRAHIRNR